MIQQMAGFTLLEGVLVLTLSSITTATALNYLETWVVSSEKAVLHYSHQVASSSMQTHQLWAKAAGHEPPKWQEVVILKGIDSQISSTGNILLSSSRQDLCMALDSHGNAKSDC